MAFIDLDTARRPVTAGLAHLDAATLFELGLCLALSGEGDDLVEAHVCFNLADRAGDERAAVHRQEVAGQMSKAELARALKAARAAISARPAARPAPLTVH